MKEPRPCKYCGIAGTHLQFACFKRPKKPSKTKKPRPIRKIGKVGQKWLQVRKEWIKLNPGPWICYICYKELDKTTLTLDHLIPRSRDPSLRYEHSNLRPCCYLCNSIKGSRVYHHKL